MGSRRQPPPTLAEQLDELHAALLELARALGAAAADVVNGANRSIERRIAEHERRHRGLG